MSFNTDFANIEKILVGISKIQNYIKGFDIVHFVADDKLQDAVFRNIIIIGNSLQNISQSTKYDFPDIEFPRVVAIANYVSHDYFKEDNTIIWHFVNKDLIEYKTILSEIKSKME